MNNPDISLILSARRPELWQKIHSNLATYNKSAFELVFAGPNAPKFVLPSNMSFIHSTAKPAQCWELAFRHSMGEYVLPVADDLLYTRGYLDSLLAYTKDCDMDSTVVIPHLSLNNRWRAKKKCNYHGSNVKWPIVGMHALMKRQVWHDLGGLDKRFQAICWNNDLILRFYEQGGTYILSDKSKCLSNEARFASPTIRLTAKFVDFDWQVTQDLWHDEQGELLPKRKAPLDPYSDEDLLVGLVKT